MAKKIKIRLDQKIQLILMSNIRNDVQKKLDICQLIEEEFTPDEDVNEMIEAAYTNGCNRGKEGLKEPELSKDYFERLKKKLDKSTAERN